MSVSTPSLYIVLRRIVIFAAVLCTLAVVCTAPALAEEHTIYHSSDEHSNDIVWTVWGDDADERGKLPPTTTSGNYSLVEDTIAITTPWELKTSDVVINLCLNGSMIQYVNSVQGSVIVVHKGATLNIYDCNSAKKTHTVSSTRANLAYVGEKTYDGGVITGGTGTTATPGNNYGGGIYVEGNLTLYAGTIAQNSVATNGGGGVCASRGGNFTMYGGTICDNYAQYCGGGVQARYSGTFTMYGGLITRNKQSGDSMGSGVFINEQDSGSQPSTFVMTGGTITGNEQDNIHFSGGTSGTLSGDAEITGNVNLGAGCSATVSGDVKIEGDINDSGSGVIVDDTVTITGTVTTGSTAKYHITMKTRPSAAGTVTLSTESSLVESSTSVMVTITPTGTHTVESVKIGGSTVYPAGEGSTSTLTEKGGSCEFTMPASTVVVEVVFGAHTFGESIQEIPATCTATGTRAHKICSACLLKFDSDGNYLADLTIPALGHSYTYTGSENVITGTCSRDSTHELVTATLTAPESVLYNGEEQPATISYSPTFPQKNLAITYTKADGTSLGTTAPRDIGTYTASITHGGVTASVSYTISDSVFTISIPAAVDITSGQTSATATISIDTTKPFGLPSTKTLNVYLLAKSDGLTLKEESHPEITIPYKLKYTDITTNKERETAYGEVINDNIQLIKASMETTTGRENTLTNTLTFTYNADDVIFAGDYSDTLTFNIAVEPVATGENA